jgi:hypothetical protein
MKLVFFRTNSPKRFAYRPRYYNPEKEAMQRRKAEMGLTSELNENETLRARMSARWRQKSPEKVGSKYQPIRIIVYAAVAVVSIYLIFFTDMIYTIIHSFGL